MPSKTFEQWKKEVDAHIIAKCGLSSDDLPDCCYMQWYEDHVSPKVAASRAIRNARE